MIGMRRSDREDRAGKRRDPSSQGSKSRLAIKTRESRLGARGRSARVCGAGLLGSVGFIAGYVDPAWSRIDAIAWAGATGSAPPVARRRGAHCPAVRRIRAPRWIAAAPAPTLLASAAAPP